MKTYTTVLWTRGTVNCCLIVKEKGHHSKPYIVAWNNPGKVGLVTEVGSRSFKTMAEAERQFEIVTGNHQLDLFKARGVSYRTIL